MGDSKRMNPTVTLPRDHAGTQDPTVAMTRDQFGDVDDPNRVARHYRDDTVCPRCQALYRDERWTRDEERVALLLAAGTSEQVICPACKSLGERLPEGILTLRGEFWQTHRAEILSLLRNVEDAGMQDNPTARILEIREEDETLVVETANEKLAQQLGRSLAKAYHGKVDYHWGDGNHLVRVYWER